MISPVSFLTNLRQDRLQRSEMFSLNKIINAPKRSRGILKLYLSRQHFVCFEDENSLNFQATSAISSLIQSTHGWNSFFYEP